MAVDNQKLIQQTFKLLEEPEKASNDVLASRARLLALRLQQSERESNELEVQCELLKEAIEQVLEAVGDHKKVRVKSAKGKYSIDITKLLKKALSPYADSAYARSVVKVKKKDKKSKKGKKK